ncbi:MAG: S9 family peptidase [Planctomycetaceae bacterium]|nr:S9 family peptidase [Planctomycetaceae bacterium]
MPRSILVLFLLLTGLAAPGSARAEELPVLQPMDVFQFQYASDPQISPDGTQVAYLRNFMDVYRDRKRSHLWIVNSDGTGHQPLLAREDCDVSQPRWSPDGTRIACVLKDLASEGEPAQIHCVWLNSGQSARLTRTERTPDNLTWSPDGTRLACTMPVPDKSEPFVKLPTPPEGATWADAPQVIRGVRYRADGQGYLEEAHQQVFVIPAEAGSPRALTSGRFDHRGPLAWAADGQAVYFSANRDSHADLAPEQSDLYRVNLADGQLTQITRRTGADHTPVFSPDGRLLAWLGFDDRHLSEQHAHLYVAQPDGSQRRELASGLDRDIQSPVWSADGKGLYFQYDDRGTTKIGYAPLAGDVQPLADEIGGVSLGRPYPGGSFSATGNGLLAFTWSTPDHPADVALQERGQKPVRLTRLNDAFLAQRQMATTELTSLKSSVDNQEIQYWVVRPPGFDPQKKYPLILEIHGGPFANYGSRFSLEIQHYAAAGYIVVYVNPRGSTGYGEKFANELHHAYPGRDYDDMMDAVDALVASGQVDADQLYVTGGSGGGIMTAWTVTQTNRFRAAAAVKPAINWYSFALTTDISPYFTQYWFPGAPWKHAEHYLKLSPITHVENVTTPTMLMTGIDDYRTPISEAEQFYQALQLRRVDTMLVRVPGASHNIVARPSRLIMKVSYILKWFEQHRDTPRAR